MPATPARIGFVQQEFRRAISTTSSVQTKYGSLARQSDDPIETFFDNVSDAQTVANARQSLMSGDRRRFNVQVTGLSEVLALAYTSAAPLARYVDPERQCDFSAVVCDIRINFGRQSAAMTVWG